MTFNIGNGMAEAEQLGDYLHRAEADIVGLQEVSVEQAEAIERDLADHYPYRLLQPTGYSGKGLLSRYPLSERTQLDFAPSRPDMHASVFHPRGPIDVYVAHPRPPKVRLRGATFDAATIQQIEAVATLAVAGDATIVLGDFNMTARNPKHAFMESLGLIDAFIEAGGVGFSFPARVGNEHRFRGRVSQLALRPVVRIDYIWTTNHLTASSAWIGESAGSDHLAVLARLSWRDRPDAEAPDAGSGEP